MPPADPEVAALAAQTLEHYNAAAAHMAAAGRAMEAIIARGEEPQPLDVMALPEHSDQPLLCIGVERDGCPFTVTAWRRVSAGGDWVPAIDDAREGRRFYSYPHIALYPLSAFGTLAARYAARMAAGGSNVG